MTGPAPLDPADLTYDGDRPTGWTGEPEAELLTTTTVQIHLIIDIQVDDMVDTDIPVDEWNAMDPKARWAVVKEIWDTGAQQDNGGAVVVTPGAKEI